LVPGTRAGLLAKAALEKTQTAIHMPAQATHLQEGLGQGGQAVEVDLAGEGGDNYL
jgi:hypothetical protein